MFIAGGNQQRRRSVKDSTPDGLEGGVRFGVYEIDCHADGSLYELGRGAMGVTYRATDTSLQRKVALKLIKTEVTERSADAREGFVREARAAAALRHKNIATVYQFAMRLETGQYFYAMELLDGATLEERVHRAGLLHFRATIDKSTDIRSRESLISTNFVLVIREQQAQKPRIVMKKPAIWVCFVLALGISLGIVACVYIPPEGVYIQTFIEIYPGTKITETDQSKLDAVLRKFDKSLYQIRKYERGQLVETKGSLADALISQTLVTAIDKASQQGVSGSTAAIYYPRKVVGMWPKLPMTPILPTMTSTPWNPAGERLVHEVTPILAKYIKNYSHDQVANVGR